jgi:hypothetical protein
MAVNEHDEELIDRLLVERDSQAAPPGSPLARARARAHQQFDPLWQRYGMKRTQAYRWLARMMGIPVERCHFVLFSEGDCEEAVKICRREVLRRAGE